MFSTHHKTIGVQYLWLALASVLVGMVLSALLRLHATWPERAIPFLASMETTPERFAAMRLLHGSLMVFFVLTAAPQLGFGNYLLPLQIGAEEMAFPLLNLFSFWMTVSSLLGVTASFFLPLASAFLVRKGSGEWVPVHIPRLLWFNTAILLASSATLEMARKRLAHSDEKGFRKLWRVSTVFGVLFLVGQLVAWRILAGQGIYLATNPASSFFYIFTGAHALHLVGGVCALLYVAWRKADQTHVSLGVVAEVTSYYWHFMDALGLFLLALLYLGK